VVNLDTINNDFTFSGSLFSGVLFFQNVQLIGESGGSDELSDRAISPLDGTVRINAVTLVRTCAVEAPPDVCERACCRGGRYLTVPNRQDVCCHTLFYIRREFLL
jgi:hypothetical protein